jgi:magnesium-transporting ATPase (P-type)
LFGLVVFTGMDTKMMMCSRYSTSKMDYYTKVSNLLTLLFLFMIAFFALISIIVLLSRSDDLGFLKQYDADAASGLKIFNLLVLYS